jgi:hypothetical protein
MLTPKRQRSHTRQKATRRMIYMCIYVCVYKYLYM